MLTAPGYLVVTDHSDGQADEWLADLVIAEMDGFPEQGCALDMSTTCRTLAVTGSPQSGIRNHYTEEFWCWHCTDNLVRAHDIELRYARSDDRERLSQPMVALGE